MEMLHPLFNTANLRLATQLLSGTLFAILFLQSGFNKVFDWNGNLEWLKGYFSKTPFRNVVAPMLLSLTALECLSGILAGAGTVFLIATGDSSLLICALLLCGVTFLALFFGQRIAKDYPGAASLVPYFFLTLFTLALF